MVICATAAIFLEKIDPKMSNPCLACGACCAAFRVTFHYSELDSEPGGFVPAALANEETATLWRLRGTDHARPRCVALVGKVGESARCGIYEHRPSPCREFAPLAEVGVFSAACNRARSRHGLPPLEVSE
jgi:Fe-S-cluster containining protein